MCPDSEFKKILSLYAHHIYPHIQHYGEMHHLTADALPSENDH